MQITPKHKGGNNNNMKNSTMMSKTIIRKILVTYTYVTIWILLSGSVIIFNKYILDKKLYNWPFPLSLTMIHMGFSSILSFLLIKVFKLCELPNNMSTSYYFSSIVPIGVLYALSLWSSNSAYIYLSVSFIQMLKALMPVMVYTLNVFLKTQRFEAKIMTNMIVISIGVAIAAYGEAKFDIYGVLLQIVALVFESTRLVLIDMLLKSKGINLNPVTSLYYIAPSCFVFLSIPWFLVEFPILWRKTVGFEVDFVVFTSNCVCAFGLNLAVFLLVGKTSALTMNVAGVVKDWLLIAISWSVIKDTITEVNLMGYFLAFLGVLYYKGLGFQKLKAEEALKKEEEGHCVDDEETKKLLVGEKEIDWVNNNNKKNDDTQN
ncbi:hypothetical protein RND81_03G131600 [Saponaria officinalis]|uniref:Sugar phosphate transporter domain-containing protein n=1 Tax=Saponaria officinalis TaxID=3572 RepID=A0AAW1M6T5_SAPOF